MVTINELREVIAQPHESLTVEVKQWLDMKDPRHLAKIVKAVIALRNRNGGFLLIGFDDKMDPSPNPPENVTEVYHGDVIQKLVSKYCSETFEVSVEFPERNGIKYPVLMVPSGVRCPVAAKAEMKDPEGKSLIAINDVYVRSLHSNGTVSSAKAPWQSWPDTMQICFDNREADLGNFLRRHLSGDMRKHLRLAVDDADTSAVGRVQQWPAAEVFLRESRERFAQVVSERSLDLPAHGFWEVSLVIEGALPPHSSNKKFLRLLDQSNPRYTGWPIWMTTESFRDEASKPYINGSLWEALLVKGLDDWSAHIDFMRFDPKGRFYLRRPFQDDVGTSKQRPDAFTQLDFVLPIIRTAETIAVGLAFAKAMGCDPESAVLSYLFTWTHLKGRSLTSWANPSRMFWGGDQAYKDEAVSQIEVPANMPLSRLGSFTKAATDPLFDVFDTNIGQDVIDDLASRLLSRRLQF